MKQHCLFQNRNNESYFLLENTNELVFMNKRVYFYFIKALALQSYIAALPWRSYIIRGVSKKGQAVFVRLLLKTFALNSLPLYFNKKLFVFTVYKPSLFETSNLQMLYSYFYKQTLVKTLTHLQKIIDLFF